MKENRRIAVEILIDDLYSEVLWSQHQKYLGRNRAATCEYWHLRMIQAQQRLAEAHERHLKACAELGPATVTVVRDGDWESYDYALRDACGFIRGIGHGYASRMSAAVHGLQAATHLGLEVALC